MQDMLRKWLWWARGEIGKQGCVLECGSLNVNGSVREVFGDADTYIGIDLQQGMDVDVVMDAHDVARFCKKDYFDLVICCEMLEHDLEFWKTIEAMREVVKPGGYLIISVPGQAKEYHPYPGDYYRFFPGSIRELAYHGYEDVSCELQVTEEDQTHLIGLCFLGRKPLRRHKKDG